MATRNRYSQTPSPSDAIASLVERLFTSLRSGGAKQRRRALRELNELFADPMEGDLAGAPSPRPRVEAWMTVEVRKHLNDESWRVRKEAARLLGAMRARDAVPELNEAFRSEYGSVRRAAAQALIAISPPDLGETLVAELTNPRVKPRDDAVDALCRAGVPAVVPLCRALLGGDHPFERQAKGALRKLVYTGTDRGRPLGSIATLVVIVSTKLTAPEKANALAVVRSARPWFGAADVVGDIPSLCRNVADRYAKTDAVAVQGATDLIDYLTLGRAADQPISTLLRPATAGPESEPTDLLRAVAESNDTDTMPTQPGLFERAFEWLTGRSRSGSGIR